MRTHVRVAMSDVARAKANSKLAIRAAIVEALYAPITKDLYRQLNALTTRNAALTKSGHLSFVYKGEFYSTDPTPPSVVKSRLEPELRPIMDKYLAEIQELEKVEKPYVLNYIGTVLNQTDRLEDYYKLFPELLHPVIKKTFDATFRPENPIRMSGQLINQVLADNQKAVDYIHERMVINLLLT